MFVVSYIYSFKIFLPLWWWWFHPNPIRHELEQLVNGFYRQERGNLENRYKVNCSTKKNFNVNVYFCALIIYLLTLVFALTKRKEDIPFKICPIAKLTIYKSNEKH